MFCYFSLYRAEEKRNQGVGQNHARMTAYRIAQTLYCLCVHLRNGYTQANAQIKQHTHMHKAMDVRVKPKSYSLVKGNQTIGLLT